VAPAPRLVMCLPPCIWCTDKDATVEVFTILGSLASVCDDCAAILVAPRRIGTALVVAASAGPLPPAEAIADYLAAQEWVFARSMPKTPHEYVLLRKSADPAMHLNAVAFIRANGEPRPWRWPPRTHHYWQPGDGWEYWTMRESDTILNRRIIAEATP
jgi:hypothetical protein